MANKIEDREEKALGKYSVSSTGVLYVLDDKTGQKFSPFFEELGGLKIATLDIIEEKRRRRRYGQDISRQTLEIERESLIKMGRNK